jgi:hypothetical protein
MNKKLIKGPVQFVAFFERDRKDVFDEGLDTNCVRFCELESFAIYSLSTTQ